MKVFVVTAGCYSDYHIEGVFSTEALANEYKQKLTAIDSDIAVEPWDIDRLKAYVPRSWWEVTLYIKTGRLAETTYRYERKEMAPATPKIRRLYHTYRHDQHGEYDWVLVQSYVSFEHAKKVAVETRQKILRERRTFPQYVQPEIQNNPHAKED